MLPVSLLGVVQMPTKYPISDDIISRINANFNTAIYEEEERKPSLTVFESTLLSLMLKKALTLSNKLIVYNVANLENFVDYPKLFQKVDGATIELFGRRFSFISIDSLPIRHAHEQQVDSALATESIPVVGVFIADFIDKQMYVVYTEKYDPILERMMLRSLYTGDIIMFVFTKSPMILYDNLPLTRYGIPMRDLAPPLLKYMFPEKKEFASTLGFLNVVSLSREELKRYHKTRKLPGITTIDVLKKDVTFDQLILNQSIKDYIKFNVIEPLKHGIRNLRSLMLLGPPGSGKSTVAFAIGEKLGLPVYTIKVEMMSSKWMGETEKLANDTLMQVNERGPCIAVFRNVETIFQEAKGSTESASVYQRVLNIISEWIQNPERMFFPVFTVSKAKEIPDRVLYDANFGQVKLTILPPFTDAERKALLILFLRKYAKKHGLEFNPLDPTVDEGIRDVASRTWAFTPRELATIAMTAVNIAIAKGMKEIRKDSIQLAKRFIEIDRITRLNQIKDTIRSVKKVGIPEQFLLEFKRFTKMADKLIAKAIEQEATRETLASIRV